MEVQGLAVGLYHKELKNDLSLKDTTQITPLFQSKCQEGILMLNKIQKL